VRWRTWYFRFLLKAADGRVIVRGGEAPATTVPPAVTGAEASPLVPRALTTTLPLRAVTIKPSSSVASAFAAEAQCPDERGGGTQPGVGPRHVVPKSGRPTRAAAANGETDLGGGGTCSW
jgi:hypothetical protein